MLYHIACLVDFSKPSKAAFHAACQLAAKSGATLHVLHVTEPVAAFASEGELLFDPHETVQELTQELKTWAKNELAKSGSKAKLGKIETVFGVLVSSALDWVKKQRCNLIVLGTHGHTGLTHLLLGSVAEKILRHSPTPVLITKNGKAFPIKKILVPVDLSAHAKEALHMAERLCEKLGAKLEVAHAINMGDILRLRKFLNTGIDSQALLEAAEAHAEQRIVKLMGRKFSHIKLHIMEGEVSALINQLCKTQKIDLVLLPTHGHTGLKHLLICSTAERIARTVKANCLTFAPAKITENDNLM